MPDFGADPDASVGPGYLASLQPGEEKIVVLQRGPAGDPSAPEAACFPGDKAHEAKEAGWEAVLFVNHHAGEAPVPFCGSGAFVDVIVGVCTTRYYAGGLRSLQIQGTELVEVGGYLDPKGNNFWDVETFVRNGQTIILGSDRDSGLWIFRRTG